jgi:energy-coupling factor transport system ATP-binding protein
VDQAVDIRRLSFSYLGRPELALTDVDLLIPAGEITAIMGAGGAGKSTLCLCLNGLIPRFVRGAYQGCVSASGIDVAATAVAAMATSVGMVFQDFEGQLLASTLDLEVAFGLENQATPRAEMRLRVDNILNIVQLAAMRRQNPASLSGGQKQRLAIASVLVLEPMVLVMDESTTELDSRGRSEVLGVVGGLARAGRSVVLVEHDPELVAQHAGRLVLMRRGRVIAQGFAQALLTNIALLESCGVAIPQMVELFDRLGYSETPVTVEQAIEVLGATARGTSRLARPRMPSRSVGRPLVEAHNVSYVYRDRDVSAIRDVSLALGAREFVAIVGQNGSGKTTLAKLLSGLIRPTTGNIVVEGTNAESMSRHEHARTVGYVFQNPDHQLFASSVREEVGVGPRNLGVPKDEVDRRVALVLHATGLDGYDERDPFTLSRGERKRLTVATVLAMRPRVLFLDEPTAGLDYKRQQEIMAMLRALYRAGHTIVIITHSLRIVADHATRIIVMQEGRVIRNGWSRDVFRDMGTIEAVCLQPPPVVELGNRLGLSTLTVHEMVRALRPDRGREARRWRPATSESLRHARDR